MKHENGWMDELREESQEGTSGERVGLLTQKINIQQ